MTTDLFGIVVMWDTTNSRWEWHTYNTDGVLDRGSMRSRRNGETFRDDAARVIATVAEKNGITLATYDDVSWAPDGTAMWERCKLYQPAT